MWWWGGGGVLNADGFVFKSTGVVKGVIKAGGGVGAGNAVA